MSFSYTVGAGQDTGDLAVTSFNPNGATLQDAAGNSASLSGAVTNPAGTLQIDTTAPTVTSVVTSGSGIDGGGNGDLNAGHVVTLTVNLSEAVTVAGGTPTLSLSNGGTASYSGGSGTALSFSYTVGAGQDTGDLAVTSFNPNGATLQDAAGNSASLSGAVTNPAGTLQIDTTAPTVTSVVTSGSGIDGGGNGDLNAGHVVTLTVNLSEAVTVAGGTPTLSLSNGGTASYSGGSGTALSFSYTVGAGQDTGDLAVTSFNPNGATLQDAAGNSASLSGAVTNPAGTLQIDTTAPTVPTIISIVLGGAGGIHWVLTGTAEANSTVAIFEGNTQLATVTASVSGSWSYTTTGSVTNSSTCTFTAIASDAAGNASASSAAWIEGIAGNDTFAFASEASLAALGAVIGNGGADTISMTTAMTLNTGDFANVTSVQTLQLTGANTITLGADAAAAGIVNVIAGTGATSITDTNGVTLNVNRDGTGAEHGADADRLGSRDGDRAGRGYRGDGGQRCLECDDSRGCLGTVDCDGQRIEHDHSDCTDNRADVDLDRQQRRRGNSECRGIVRQPGGRRLHGQSHGDGRHGCQYNHGRQRHQHDHRWRRCGYTDRRHRQRHLQLQFGGQSGCCHDHRRRRWQ